ncbi:hypothetical protein LJC31_06960 [Synergistaceae bacterium OttesenSCG-928-I11]|nr:hypothetical protein [Synergistaceae bacterium OttesenSCG-928-I11]
MSRIMEDIEELTGGRSFQSYKYSFDSVRTPTPDYDDNPDEIESWARDGESKPQNKATDLREFAIDLARNRPIPCIQFFLDGSRHVYHVDDISYDSRVFPVVAGQVGVACCQRIDARMRAVQPAVRKLVISLPNKCDKSGRYPELFLRNLRTKINDNPRLQERGLMLDDVLTYKTADPEKSEFRDRGIATIQDYMIDAEKAMVDSLAQRGLLSQTAYLVKDGSLEYQPMQNGSKYANLKNFKNSYQYVIGVSKSFNPENCKDGKGNSNARAIIELPQFYRTPVSRFRVKRIPDIEFAVWYIRLRKFPEQTKTPFDGVIKVEKIMVTDNETRHGRGYGLDTEDVDMLSATLINERCPTCYGSDLRFANHLYPIYLTESYIKSLYLSGDVFLNLF